MPKAIDLSKPRGYVPYEGCGVKEKSTWTERRLQRLQSDLFKVFKKCKCHCRPLVKGNKKDPTLFNAITCNYGRACDDIVVQMSRYLVPYGYSIFKRSFKVRATCEEMDRVVQESVNALLEDIWFKSKYIHTSFGSMLKWKMIYYLDGHINLFDFKINYKANRGKDVSNAEDQRYVSIESMAAKFPTSNQDSNSEDLIEYYSDTFQDAFFTGDTYKEVIKEETIKSVVDLARSLKDHFNKMITPRQKYAIYIRVVFALNRFLNNRESKLIIRECSKTRFYYAQLLDVVRMYLKKLSCTN